MDERQPCIRVTRPHGAEADGHPLPETLVEADWRVALIERAVQRKTGHGVRDLCVELREEGVLLRGRCSSYYTKQLAQHAAMTVPGGDAVTNEIEVST